MKIVGKASGEIDVKRFYIPGLEVQGNCPKCRAEFTRDFSTDYLSYPQIGEPKTLHLYCPECDHEWQRQMVLDISLKLIKE